jgi:phthiodiolone/phenolphthiodiolone dimycocerosates ketoreductase
VEVGTGGNVTPPVESLLRTAQSAERRGYDALWWPDHLMGWHPQSMWTTDITPLAHVQPNPHVYLDPIAAIAAVAVHTERVRLGTSVTESVRRHPAVLATEFLSLDHLSHGRVVLGIGAGERENIEPYGLSYERPVSRFEESLRIIRLLWEHDDPVDFDGEFWTLRDAVVGMGPFRVDEDGTRHYPPIWAGAHGPRMLKIVGRHCDGWLPTYPGSTQVWSQLYEQIVVAARDAGRDPDAITPAVWCLLIVDEDEAEIDRLLSAALIRAWMLVQTSDQFEALGFDHPLGSPFHGLTDYVPSRLTREQALDAIAQVPMDVTRRYTLCGTPDEVLDELRAFASAGARHVVLQNVTFMADPTKLRSSFALQDEIAAALRAM